jgi:hypothetical protein
MPRPTDLFVDHAKRAGAFEVGHFRVVVLEHDNRVRHHDFATRNEAVQYADDVASEEDQPIARVFDDHVRMIYEGRHYGGASE